jgi:hypothetical protein
MTSSRNDRCNRFGRSSCSSLDRSSSPSPICDTGCSPKRWSPSPCPRKRRCKKWFPKKKCRSPSPCPPKYKWLPTGRCEIYPPTYWKYDSPALCCCGYNPCRCRGKSPSPYRRACRCGYNPCRCRVKSPSPYHRACGCLGPCCCRVKSRSPCRKRCKSRSRSPCHNWKGRPCTRCHRPRWDCCCERPIYRLVSTCGNYICCANRRQEFLGLPVDHGWNPIYGWNSPQRIGWI